MHRFEEEKALRKDSKEVNVTFATKTRLFDDY